MGIFKPHFFIKKRFLYVKMGVSWRTKSWLNGFLNSFTLNTCSHFSFLRTTRLKLAYTEEEQFKNKLKLRLDNYLKKIQLRSTYSIQYMNMYSGWFKPCQLACISNFFTRSASKRYCGLRPIDYFNRLHAFFLYETVNFGRASSVLKLLHNLRLNCS